MVYGCAKFRKSGLGIELKWDTGQSASLEAKVLREKGTDGREIILARE